MGSRNSPDRIIELVSLLIVATVCYLIVSGLRWAEHTAWVRGQPVAYIVAVTLHLAIDFALVFVLARSLYRWARGRPLFR